VVSLLIQGDSDPHELLQVSRSTMFSLIHTGGPQARAHTLQPPTRPDPIRRITSFFLVLPLGRGTKRQTDTNATPNSRSVRTRGTFPRPTRFQRHSQTRSPPRRRMRSPRPRRALPLPVSSATDDPGTPPGPPGTTDYTQLSSFDLRW
jgi:hypothetical protein